MSTTVAAVHFAQALTHASGHRAEIARSTQCGCFSCFRRFEASEITAWIDKNETALCPRCGIDSVLGGASVISLDDRFLRNVGLVHSGAGATRGRAK